MNWRRIILTSLVCFSFSTVGAQTLSQEYINLCNEFFKDIRLWGYCGKLDCTTESNWHIKLKENTYYNDFVSGSPNKDSIVFSPVEIQYLNDTLDKLTHVEWKAGNILDSITFFQKQYIDSIAQIYKKNRSYSAPRYGDHYCDRFACRRLYKISHPVFLRKNSICVFSWSIESREGPASFMVIYIKKNNRWKEFKELYGSIGESLFSIPGD